MTRRDALALVGTLAAAYRLDLGAETATLYAAQLEPFDAHETADAIQALISVEERFPSIARIRREIGDRRAMLPSPIEAWQLVVQGAAPLPQPVREARDAIGGPWAIRTHDQPSILRAQFIKAYEEIRAHTVIQATEDAARGLPPGTTRKEIA